MSDSLQQQLRDRNLQSQQGWEAFAPHRERLRQLIQTHAPESARSLCVLGAGNANDLDLAWFSSRFERIVLVDLDEQAMRAGVARQKILLPNLPLERIEIAQHDVTGAVDLLTRSAQDIGKETSISELGERFKETPLVEALGEQFHCVVSACLLSQLIDSVLGFVGEGDPQFLPLVQGVRRQHLSTVLQLTAAGGLAVSVLDFVSSLTCPDLLNVSEHQLGAYAAQQVSRGNFFTGLQPPLLEQCWRELLSEQRPGSRSWVPPPWRWSFGPRTYLVMCLLAHLA